MICNEESSDSIRVLSREREREREEREGEIERGREKEGEREKESAVNFHKRFISFRTQTNENRAAHLINFVINTQSNDMSYRKLCPRYKLRASTDVVTE